jgi:17beta-estradiol 17-dehydrogenase/3beta-hydroxysteroid 3-dehydrogenase
LLISELLEKLDSSGDGRIIWTSSDTSSKKVFKMNDIQHLNGEFPYESSKYASELLSLSLNSHFKSKKLFVRSIVTSPGVVATTIALPEILKFFCLIPLFLLVKMILF